MSLMVPSLSKVESILASLEKTSFLVFLVRSLEMLSHLYPVGTHCSEQASRASPFAYENAQTITPVDSKVMYFGFGSNPNLMRSFVEDQASAARLVLKQAHAS